MIMILLTGCPLVLGSSFRQISYYPDQASKLYSERYVTFLWKLYCPYICLALGHTVSSELKPDMIGILVTVWRLGCDVNILHSSTFGCAPVKEFGASTVAGHHCATLKAGPEGTRGQKSQPGAWLGLCALLSPSCYSKTSR